MGNVCSICNSPLSKILLKHIDGNGKLYDLYLCESCKIGVTVPMPSQTDLSTLYSAEEYRSEDGKRFNSFMECIIFISRLQRKRRIKKYIKNGRILDIGCGRGLFLNIMKNDGWNVTGVEFNKEIASNISGVYGINMISGEPAEWGFSDGSFDVITMSHVLEHLTNPLEIILECKRLLKKGGLFINAAPNIDSLQAYIGKKNWFHLDIPYHIYHFSETGLIRLLEMNSFKILRIRRFDLEYNPFGWLQTLLNIFNIKKNLFYSILKKSELRKKEFAVAKKRDIFLTLIMLPLYVPLSFLLSIFESFVLKRGGTIEVYAIKE